MKDIKDFEGLYAITSCGRVWSYRKQKFLQPNTDKDGYLYVVLSVNQKRKTVKIHRLVANAYIQNDNNFTQVNHRDENKQNNCVNNLEWCDSKYNDNYGTRNKRMGENHKGKTIGDKHPVSKKIICIETMIVYGSIREASRECNIHSGCICKCCKRERETAGGFHWMYYNDYLKLQNDLNLEEAMQYEA